MVMKADAGRALAAARAALEAVDDWATESLEQALRAMLATESLSVRKGWQPIRVAITGSNISPPLFESLAGLPEISPSPGSPQLSNVWPERMADRPGAVTPSVT